MKQNGTHSPDVGCIEISRSITRLFSKRDSGDEVAY